MLPLAQGQRARASSELEAIGQEVVPCMGNSFPLRVKLLVL